MKTFSAYTEEHYRRNWEELMKPVPGNDYMNLEGDLDEQMELYEKAIAGTDLPETEKQIQVAKIRQQKAKELVAKVTPKLKETMAMIKRIQTGKASLGYTTWNSERSNMARLVERFEFNCLQLADLKKKYDVK